MIKPLTNEEFLIKLKNTNKDILPLDNYYRSSKKIRFKCLIDNNIFSATPNNILRGHGCPKCGQKKCGENGRKTKLEEKTLLINKRPILSKSLKNINDAYNYGYMSRKELDFICPDCNYEFKKSPSFILEDYLACPNCIKRSKYPNRFMKNILMQLNIAFIDEYSPEWIGLKRYDFYFEINDSKYIVEMDGGFHRYEDSRINDSYKDEMAQKHNINVIRIDCDYGKIGDRYDYIKTNIINSEISTILDLSNVDFDKADTFGFENECKEVCDLWSQYHDLDIIKEKTGFTLYTIKKHLDFGNKNNMCLFDRDIVHEDRKKKRIKNGIYAGSIQVKCIETGEYFPNMKIAGDKYKCNVSRYFYQNGTYAGILEDGTKLHWEKVSHEEFLKYTSSTKETS